MMRNLHRAWLLPGLLMGALFLAPQSAHALIINFGVDIFNNGTNTLPGTAFYGGDAFPGTGVSLTPSTSYTLTLDTASVFGAYTINSAVLYVDAAFVNGGGTLADLSNVIANGSGLGALSDNFFPTTQIPVMSGGTTGAGLFDIDSSFFTLPAGVVSQLGTDSTFTIQFQNLRPVASGFGSGILNAARTFRVDGINIQVDATEIQQLPPPPAPVIPEPISSTLFGLGLLGMGMQRRFNKRAGTTTSCCDKPTLSTS